MHWQAFASAGALVNAIEAADSLEPEKVASIMRTNTYADFYSYAADALGQNRRKLLVLQCPPRSRAQIVGLFSVANDNAWRVARGAPARSLPPTGTAL